MTSKLISAAKKAALLKKFKRREASRSEAISRALQERDNMPKFTIEVIVTDGGIAIRGPDGLPPPLLLGYLGMAYGLVLKNTIDNPAPPSIVQAPASVLDQLSK